MKSKRVSLSEKLRGISENQVISLDLLGNRFSSFLSHTDIDSKLGDEGAIKLSESLKLNTTLTSLYYLR